jgi:DnaK suppressor protein
MPDRNEDTEVDHLTPAQIELLRGKLVAARDQITARAQAGSKLRSERDVDVGDAMDAAASSAEAEDAYAYSERDRVTLVRIERALAKLERGEDYGVSEASGEPIGFRRLEAVPWARLTIEEEESLERRARGR